jgi:carbamoylphosphate synthase large subunit
LRPSWSTATPKPCRPITTRRTASISSRDGWKTCSKSCDKEEENGEVAGLILQYGGQTPLKLAADLEAAGVPIFGTSPDAIDLAEDRERFQMLLQDLKLLQPANGTARSGDEAVSIATEIGYPVVIRPSYVLGGRGNGNRP